MNSWIQIFKAGAYPGKLPVTVADIKTMAATYDPARCEAPLVLGHPDTDSPAHGWVEKLRVVGDQLWARVGRVTSEARALVREGAFRHISMAVFPDFQGTGKMYLRHVGLLGGAIPAVQGMTPVKFADGTYEHWDDLQMPIGDALDRNEAIMRVLDGCYLLMDRIHGILDDETIPDRKLAILDQVESLRGLIEAETFTEGQRGGVLMNFWEKLKALFAEAGVKVPGEEQSRGSAGQFTEAQVQEREQAAATRARQEAETAAARTARAQAVHAEVAAFVDAGVKAGTFLPAWRDGGIPAVWERLLLEDAEVTFADGQPPKKAGEILKGLLASLPKIVPLGEHAPGAAADPEAALKAEFAVGKAVHDQMGVTFEGWKKVRKS